VRRSGPRVRIAVDLVEVEAGAQIWSERFEGVLDDVFALQDEVANAVAARIEPTIQAADLRRGAARPTEDLGAYDLFLRAQQRYREFDNAGFKAAIVLFEQAVARDPSFAQAWSFLALLHVHNLVVGWTEHRGETLLEARDAIRHVLRTNDDDAVALACVAWAGAALEGDRRSYLAMADRALMLNPGSFSCWVYAGYASLWGGRYEQALERFRHSVRLNPRAPERHHALMGTGAALLLLERFEEALPWLNEAITAWSDYPMSLFYLATALSHLGRIQDAKAALARFEALASLKDVIDMLGQSKTLLSGLRRLGVDV
jgi:adenylate cyclase